MIEENNNFPLKWKINSKCYKNVLKFLGTIVFFQKIKASLAFTKLFFTPRFDLKLFLLSINLPFPSTLKIFMNEEVKFGRHGMKNITKKFHRFVINDLLN
jgi:hypothetical protein